MQAFGCLGRQDNRLRQAVLPPLGPAIHEVRIFCIPRPPHMPVLFEPIQSAHPASINSLP
ncbi:hypothetical protein [Maliponia aquimaris]|uniref:Uncharacterized protein n=1 Tax=Maliponia aquimaris TaxID=1673631 RepID=A0A238KUD5_9RHOB|nr:hypothetical protein [Maliponia aquimaris]SMX46443.1 hypothetical protein MAA8898_03399 [Maliponia aquimaris]